MRNRVLLTLPVLVLTLTLAAAPAFASTGRAAATAPAAGPVPARGMGQAAPGLTRAGRIVDSLFNGVSCTNQPDNPHITITCQAVGFASVPGSVNGLMGSETDGSWSSGVFGDAERETDPLDISCVPQPATLPACVSVGLTSTNQAFPKQLIAAGDANGVFPVSSANPRGATWSVLASVSCATSRFCLLVGAHGTTRRHGRHGLTYLSRASTYEWNGTSARPLAAPSPPRARSSELASVSCPTPTFCLAVGDYTSASGHFLPYSAAWLSGKWQIQQPRTTGRGQTLFQGVSCAAAERCQAVGDTSRGPTAIAEIYIAGAWRVQRVPAGGRSLLLSVSCPDPSHCMAAGQRGTKPMIQTWNGSRWAAQAVPATRAPETVDLLQHVSCVTARLCTAVGYGHNPKIQFAFRTMAVGWNGSSWSTQMTPNN